MYPEAPPPEAPGRPSSPGYPPPPPPPADVIVLGPAKAEDEPGVPFTPAGAEGGPPAPPPPTVIGKLDAVTVIGPAPSKGLAV